MGYLHDIDMGLEHKTTQVEKYFLGQCSMVAMMSPWKRVDEKLSLFYS